jgi:haloalkane dehalogenase
MRRLLGQPELAMPYSHPSIVNPLTVFGRNVSRTGVVFGGLGCPNGCDFCCTSHFFQRKHVRLLPTGADIYAVIQRYMNLSSEMSIIILDEDFLLNRKRALEFRDCVLRGGKALSIFCFASVKAISRYTVTEILEMGIDGLWIGYEGTRSGFKKQSGRPVEEIFTEFREHGITILASMIVGFEYQTPKIIEEELSGLLALKPSFSQFLIYGPVPGTPFYDRIVEQGLFRQEVRDDPEMLCRKATGFDSLVKHPNMSASEIERLQDKCFEEDFMRLGPSIFRCIETWFLGYLKLRDSENPILLDKAKMYERLLRGAYPVFLAGRCFGPTREIRHWIGQLQGRIHAVVGRPTWVERFQAFAGLGLAATTGITLKLGWFQHPKLIRHTYGEEEKVRPLVLQSEIPLPRISTG